MMVDLSMDSPHVPIVLSPSASSKMNGSIHHRHAALNLSTISTTSSKHESKLGLVGAGSSSANVMDSTVVADFTPEVTPVRKTSGFGQTRPREHCVNQILGLLALLSVVAVLLAFLAITFFLKITPAKIQDGNDLKRFLSAEECRLVYEVVLGLIMCTLSLDFTCFLVCASQFLFAAKLLKIAQGEERASKYLQCGSCSRGIAVCGFFISVPVFVTAIILYAFIHFHNMSAIIAGALLGGGILVSGIAIIHNALLWQREHSRTIHYSEKSDLRSTPPSANQNSSMVPQMELSTLV